MDDKLAYFGYIKIFRILSTRKMDKDILGLVYLQEFFKTMGNPEVQKEYLKACSFINELYKNENFIIIDYNLRDFDL
jgi:hypothetical protein